MPLNVVRRGGGILRKLPANGTFARSVHVATPQHHIRCISFVARRSLPTSITRALPRSSSIVGNLARSYATAEPSKAAASGESTKTKKAAKTPAKPAKKSAKKPVKKPAKKRTKAPLTEEQKEKKKAKDLKKTVQQLKETALKLPKSLPNSVWLLAITAKMADVGKDIQSRTEAFKKATQLAREISADERQRFADVADANRAANAAAYEAWVQSHTPLQILEANKARRRLAKINNKKVMLIRDDRLVKRPVSPWILFFQERRDKNTATVSDMTQNVSAEWKSLPEAEKEKYREVARADRKRYEREYLDVYGTPAPEQRPTKEE
ncbi:hypothetical protein BJX76DRAFT_340525 [Aspergillus varians]